MIKFRTERDNSRREGDIYRVAKRANRSRMIDRDGDANSRQSSDILIDAARITNNDDSVARA